MNKVDAAIPGQTAATLPATPTEAVVRAVTGGVEGGAVMGPGGWVAPVAAGVGAGTGEVASQYVPDWAKPGVQLGANVAGAAGTGAAVNMVRTPVGLVDAGRAAAAKTAIDKYNIPMEASDLTDDPRFQRTGPASIQATANKQNAWQGNIIDQMGGQGNKFIPELMNDTATRTGQVYDDIASRTTIGKPQTDDLVHNDLAAIEANLDNVAGITDSDRGVIKRRLGEIVDAVGPNGTISGADYRALTKTNSPLDRLESNSNSELANVGGDISAALRAAFNKSASPEDQAALGKNDYQYRIMKTVAPLAAKSVDGNINPGQFMTAVTGASKRFDPTLGGMAYTGGGDIGELARIGSMMKVSPNMPPKGDFVSKMLKVGEGVAGAAAAGHFYDPKLFAAAAAVPAAMAVNAVRGAYLRSDFGRNVLLNNALNPPPSAYGAVGPALVTGGNTNQLLPKPPQ
jgi:hypothetical protein